MRASFLLLFATIIPTLTLAQESVKPAAPLRDAVDALPVGMTNFNGMLVGRLVRKDVEKGTFVVEVAAVPRVWRNSKATDPKSVVGKNIQVDGVFGKFLDVLLVVNKGEAVEFEAAHHGGDRLTFPGELLRKVAFRPEDFPALPEGFRGFNGAVAGIVVKKDPETMELILRVDKVLETWSKNKAREADEAIGKPILLAGFWQRQETFHGLQAGDPIEVGIQHISIRSDHVSVAEFVRPGNASNDGLPDGIRGFSGMLIGRLASKDVEKGEFVVHVDAVPRVWRNNKATRPKSVVGQTIDIDGVFGKWLDVLLVLKAGETVEFEAHDNGGDNLAFAGEWMRKTAPVKPGDYPELPEDFRGFRGSVTGKVVKKSNELAELTIEVLEVDRDSEESTAKNATAIIGQQVIVLGFWRMRDSFDTLQVGDKIACQIEHLQARSDHVNVRKFEKVKQN